MDYDYPPQREAISKPSARFSPYGGRSEYDAHERAVLAMMELGFRKVINHCVYDGDVAALVDWLKSEGWVPLKHDRNPYILKHPDTYMIFNYAETERRPSQQFISLFRNSCPGEHGAARLLDDSNPPPQSA